MDIKKTENTNINCFKNYEHERDKHENIATQRTHKETGRQVDIQAEPSAIPVHLEVKRSLAKFQHFLECPACIRARETKSNKYLAI